MSIYIIGGRRIIPYDVILEKKEREIEKEVAKYSFPHVTQESIRVALLFSRAQRFIFHELFEPLRFRIRLHGPVSVNFTYSFRLVRLEKSYKALNIFLHMMQNVPKQYYSYSPQSKILYRIIREYTYLFQELIQMWKQHSEFVKTKREFSKIPLITFPKEMALFAKNRLKQGSLFKADFVLGKGGFGTVFQSKDPRYVLKKTHVVEDGFHEAAIGLLLEKAPTPHYVILSRGGYFHQTTIVFKKINTPTFDTIDSPFLLWDILRQVLLSLRELHNKGLVHCDIKSENILGKLIDYGCLNRVGATDMDFDKIIKHPKIAHNCLLGKLTPLFIQVDTWELGCELYKITFGHYPYINYRNNRKIDLQSIASEIYTNPSIFRNWIREDHFFESDDVFKIFHPLLCDLLEPDETKALSAAAILEKYPEKHPSFS